MVKNTLGPFVAPTKRVKKINLNPFFFLKNLHRESFEIILETSNTILTVNGAYFQLGWAGRLSCAGRGAEGIGGGRNPPAKTRERKRWSKKQTRLHRSVLYDTTWTVERISN